MASLPFNLSATDAAVFKSLQAAALLPQLATPGEGEFVSLYRFRKYDENKKVIAPYADILEHELTKMLERRKASILNELESCKGTNFTAKLFEWTTVLYHEGLESMKRRVSEMTFEEHMAHITKMRERQLTIERNKWETMFSVEAGLPYGYDEYDEPDCTLPPVKADRIFRQSDLALRLSLKLGPNFYPFTEWEAVEDAGEEGEHGYKVWKKTLCVRYYPFGVTKTQMLRLLGVAKEQAGRVAKGEVRRLGASEYGIGHEALNILHPLGSSRPTGPAPAPAPAPVPLLGATRKGIWLPVRGTDGEVTLQDFAAALRKDDEDRCFCGCTSEEE